MSARLAEAYYQDTLIPRGRDGFRRVPAISHAAVTGSIGATYGEDGSRVGRGIHNVTVRRAGA